jgi:patatin-like phospholipase/acyl hydrolase
MPGADGKARFSTEDALSLYLQKGAGIFHSGLADKITRGWGLWDEKYSVKNLQQDLNDFFGDTTLDQLIKPCLITSYEITARQAVFFTSADATDAINNFYVRDVARATSAAPTYFEPAHIKSLSGQEYALVDGGVFANNPALCAYAEIRKTAFSKALNDDRKPDLPTAKDMLFVSLGTGTVQKPYTFDEMKNAGELKWLDPIIDILMSGNSETVCYQLMQLYKTLEGKDRHDYYRIEPPLREALPEMDDASPKNLENLRQAGLWYIDKNKDMLDEIVEKLLEHK